MRFLQYNDIDFMKTSWTFDQLGLYIILCGFRYDHAVPLNTRGHISRTMYDTASLQDIHSMLYRGKFYDHKHASIVGDTISVFTV